MNDSASWLIVGVIAIGLIVGVSIAIFLGRRPSSTDAVAKPKLRKSSRPIGYRYADIGKDGSFVDPVTSESYGVDGLVDGEATRFHSHRTIESLRESTQDEPYFGRGGLLLEVLHYGDVTELEGSWVSTGQQVLQVALDDGSCFGSDRKNAGWCSERPELMVVFGKRRAMRFCRSHYAGARKFLWIIRGKTVVNIHSWLDALEASEAGKSVRVHHAVATMEPTR